MLEKIVKEVKENKGYELPNFDNAKILTELFR